MKKHFNLPYMKIAQMPSDIYSRPSQDFGPAKLSHINLGKDKIRKVAERTF